MSTIRCQIVQALKTRLETITIANGYNTDVLNVYDFKTDTIDPTLMPAANIKDTSEEPPTRRGSVFHNILTIEISIHISGNLRSDIRNFYGDIMTAIGTDVSFGKLSENTFALGNESSSFQDSGSDEVMSMTLGLQMEYITKLFDVFNKP